MMVACSEWTDLGRNFLGYKNMREIETLLRKRCVDAQALLRNTGCDHVVYGAKYYDKDNRVSEVRFYMKPMKEKEFDAVSRMRDTLVFAVHKR